MPVTATSYASKVSDAVVRMLAASTTFQTWVSAASAALAKNKIIEDDSGGAVSKYASDGTTADLTGNWAVVRVGDVKSTDRAWLLFGKEGEAAITLVEKLTANDLPPEIIRRARNNADLIRADFEALFSTAADFIPAGILTTSPTHVADDTGSLKGRVVTILHLSWRDIP